MKSHTTNVEYKGVSSNRLSQRINHHATNGDMPQDNFLLHNHILNVVMTDVYVFGLPMVLEIFCIGQGECAIVVDKHCFIPMR